MNKVGGSGQCRCWHHRHWRTGITFGPQKDGPPQVAFLGPIQPEGDSPKAVEYYQEVAGRWTDELAAHEELDKIAQALIEQKCL